MKVYNSLSAPSPLKKSIDAALDKLKENPLSGDKIQKKLWPKKYMKEHEINNLFRYPLVDGYRLIYTIVGDKKTVTSNPGSSRSRRI
jgi:mRNA-degrading endonuclease RelE of RelBE toxin-antitoxin system